MRIHVRSIFVAVVAMLLPALASAQTGNAGIAGVVRDSSGAVLPGVTVEAASPALIEKVRTIVTDADGTYRILDLRPGVYSARQRSCAGSATLPGQVVRGRVESQAGTALEWQR